MSGVEHPCTPEFNGVCKRMILLQLMVPTTVCMLVTDVCKRESLIEGRERELRGAAACDTPEGELTLKAHGAH
ncbi:hypothetical protein FKM82_024648 [Ascaphus truei]